MLDGSPGVVDTYVILQVDMDMEDDIGEALPVVQGRQDEKIVHSPIRDNASDGNV